MIYKCKECLVEKDYSDYYKHPLTSDWILHRCKECIKKWRKSDKERQMSRILDNKRSKEKKRKEHLTSNTKKFREKFPEKYKAHSFVSSFLKKNKWFKIKECSICLSEWYIHYHHFDYSKPNQIVPCCPLCHSAIHKWTINYKDSNIVILE